MNSRSDHIIKPSSSARNVTITSDCNLPQISTSSITDPLLSRDQPEIFSITVNTSRSSTDISNAPSSITQPQNLLPEVSSVTVQTSPIECTTNGDISENNTAPNGETETDELRDTNITRGTINHFHIPENRASLEEPVATPSETQSQTNGQISKLVSTLSRY